MALLAVNSSSDRSFPTLAKTISGKKWCREINPYFNQLIKENQGYLTPVDLSVKANLTLRDAKIFSSPQKR